MNNLTILYETLDSSGPQGIVKSASKVAFIVDTEKYVKGVEGPIPVLIKSVSLSSATKDQISFL